MCKYKDDAPGEKCKEVITRKITEQVNNQINIYLTFIWFKSEIYVLIHISNPWTKYASLKWTKILNNLRPTKMQSFRNITS